MMKLSQKPVVDAAVCGCCVHYNQHYVLGQHGSLHSLWFGHCTYPGMKIRTPEESCPHWASLRETSGDGA